VSGAFQELGEPRPAAPSISVAIVYEDAHLVELEFASVAKFSSVRAWCYASRDDVGRLADTLRGFPSHPSDERVCTFGGAESPVELRLRASDVPPRCYLTLTAVPGSERRSSEIPHELQQRSSTVVRFDPAQLDEFVATLHQLHGAARGRAVLFGRRD
jgi:hypothetical protein